jgi:hypothetical protein
MDPALLHTSLVVRLISVLQKFLRPVMLPVLRLSVAD